MDSPRVIVFPDKTMLATAVADKFISDLAKLLALKDRVLVALTGGTIGIQVLREIAKHPAAKTLAWSRVGFCWGDERFLAVDDPERNELQARQAFLNVLKIPEQNIHAVPASDSGLSLSAAAEKYAKALVKLGQNGEFPSFDITFLGAGPDGHIASLFPELPGIKVTVPGVIPVTDSPKPPSERVSLTLPLLRQSKQIWLVLAGADKASALRLALAGVDSEEVPATGVIGANTTVLVDAAAAGELPEDLLATSAEFHALAAED